MFRPALALLSLSAPGVFGAMAVGFVSLSQPVDILPVRSGVPFLPVAVTVTGIAATRHPGDGED